MRPTNQDRIDTRFPSHLLAAYQNSRRPLFLMQSLVRAISQELGVTLNLQGRAREAFEQLVRENPTATKEKLFELFQMVVESDARVRDSLTQRIFDEMKEFDPERARYVMDLVKRDHPAAVVAVKILLSQMRRQ